jgi:hypothetical protein
MSRTPAALALGSSFIQRQASFRQADQSVRWYGGKQRNACFSPVFGTF